MHDSFGNIFCVGRNYASFAKVGNALPERPPVFMKPTHSIRKMDGDTLDFQGNKGELNCEADVGRSYEKGMDVSFHDGTKIFCSDLKNGIKPGIFVGGIFKYHLTDSIYMV